LIGVGAIIKKILKFSISLFLLLSTANCFSYREKGEENISKQIKFLERTFLKASKGGFLLSSDIVRWERNYTALYSTLTLGGLFLHFTSKSRAVSFNAGLTAIQSTFGTWDMVFNRFYPEIDLKRFSGMKDGHKKLKLGEAILEKAYEREVSLKARSRRLTALTINLLGGIAVWLGDERPMGGVIQFLVGTLIFEAQRSSVPTFASQSRRVYKGLFYNQVDYRESIWKKIRILPLKNGLSLNLSF